MNIIFRELRANMKSLIIWAVIVSIYLYLGFSEFSAYYNNPEMTEVLETMPQALLDAFSIRAANVTTLSGFYSMIILYMYILLGLHAVLIGSNIISKEERDKTAEFLFTLPVSRIKVISSKIIAALINCILLLAVVNIAAILCALKYDPDAEFVQLLSLTAFSTFMIQLIFLSIGMFIASILKKYKKAGAVSVALLFGTFILSVLIGISDKIDFLKYFTPFKYFDALYILNNDRIQAINLFISFIIIIAGVSGTYFFYPKRDLR